MEKHTLKAFIASFCVSLLIIFFVGNVLSSQKSDKNSMEIVPSNNIALFLRQDAPRAVRSPASEIKKISLNVIEPMVPQVVYAKEEAVFDEVLPIEIAKKESVPAVEVADAVEVVLPIEEPELPILYAKPAVGPEKIIDNFGSFIKKPVSVEIKKAEKEVDVLASKEVLYSPEIVVAEKEEDLPLLKSEELLFDGGVSVAQDISLSSKVANLSKVDFLNDSKQAEKEVAVEVVKEETPWIEMKDVKDGAAPKDATWSEVASTRRPNNKLVEKKPEEAAPVVVKKEVPKNILVPISSDAPDISGGFSSEDGVVENGEEESGGILKNIGSLFSKASSKVESEIKSKVSGVAQKVSEVKNESVEKLSSLSSKKLILPTEIRLAFAPNRVEVSGQTVRWLNAFAQKSKEEALGLEIRLDGTSSYDLQQKRLNLIYNILASKGVDEKNVRTIFSQRDPNSFIIRVIRFKRQDRPVGDYYKYYQQH